MSSKSSWGPEPHLTPSGMSGVMWFEVVVATFFVIARTLTRVWVKGKLEWDDYWVFMAWIALFIMSSMYTAVIPKIFLLYEVGAGLEAPPADFTSQVSYFLRIQFAIILMFWSCLWAVKASFLAVYKDIIDKRLSPWKNRAWWFITFLCVGSYIGCWVTQFLSCQPFYTYFEVGACETAKDLYVSNLSLFYSSALDITTDILIIALPLSIVAKISLDTKKRIALAALFSAGGLIIAFSVIRLIKTAPSYGHVDAKWLCIMSVTECSVALIVASTPAFRSFFVKRNRTQTPVSGSRTQDESNQDHKDFRKSAPIAASWELGPIREDESRRVSAESDEDDRIQPGLAITTNTSHPKSFWDHSI